MTPSRSHVLPHRERLGIRIVAVVALVASIFGASARVVEAQEEPTFYMFDNGRLRFGGGGGGQPSPWYYGSSLNDLGNLEQPLYWSATLENWYQLTFADLPLDLAIGTGSDTSEGNGNWTGSKVALNPALGSLEIRDNGFIGSSVDGDGVKGYGSLIVEGTAQINGAPIDIAHTYSLGENDSYIKVMTRLTNRSTDPVDNVHIWVGNRDDFIGSSDAPLKERGNIVDGSFELITDATQPAAALRLTSNQEGVVFYSTTPGASTSLSSWSHWDNPAVAQDPISAPITLENDGSYVLHLPVGNLAVGASAELTWFYAAGELDDLAGVISEVEAAAAPSAPRVVVLDNTIVVDWDAPETSDPIIGYVIRWKAAGDDTWTEHRSNSTEGPLSHTIEGLAKGTSYLVQVAAITNTVDGEVRGDWSVSPSVLVPQPPPPTSEPPVTEPPSNPKPTVVPLPPSPIGAVQQVPVVVEAGEHGPHLRFSGASTTGDSPELRVEIVDGSDAMASELLTRGVSAVGNRFDITVQQLTFDTVEICLPFNLDVFEQMGRPAHRLRLLHIHDGVESDITGTLQTDRNPAQLCGTTDSFSEFQLVVFAGDRIAGADRYATAASVATRFYPEGANTVYLATGESPADAMTAGAAAARADAPLLLVRGSDVPSATTTALERLNPKEIIIVGGTKSVTAVVEGQLRSSTQAAVTRMHGPDRYSTSANVAISSFPSGVHTVYVASGNGFADALAAGAAAHVDGAAVLLTAPDHLPQATADALESLAPQQVIIVGGTAAINDNVVRQIGGLVPNTERVSGTNRYGTAAALAAKTTGGTVAVATGLDFPDALVTTTVATKANAPVLLVADNHVPSETKQAMTSIAPRQLVVVGGAAAVGPAVELELTRLLPEWNPGRL